MTYKEKYGDWAFVAGGSEGMGGAFCDRSFIGQMQTPASPAVPFVPARPLLPRGPVKPRKEISVFINLPKNQ